MQKVFLFFSSIFFVFLPSGIFIIQWTHHVSTFDVTCARFFFSLLSWNVLWRKAYEGRRVKDSGWKWKYHLLGVVNGVVRHAFYMLKVNIHASHHRKFFLRFTPLHIAYIYSALNVYVLWGENAAAEMENFLFTKCYLPCVSCAFFFANIKCKGI